MVALFGEGVIQLAALALRIAEQVDIDAVLSALEIQVDQSARAAAASGGGCEQGFVGANLLAHDDDLVPLAGGSTVARRLQSLPPLQERVLVAPNEITLQQLQAQIPPTWFPLTSNT